MGQTRSNNGERLYISTPVIGLEFFAALIAIGTGGNLSSQVSSGFVGFRFLGITLMIIGVALLILSLLNCLLFRKPELSIAKSICCSVPLILVMLALGFFAFAVSCSGGSKSIPGSSYKVYRVVSYSKWMQNKIKNNWDDYYAKAVVQNKKYICAKKEVDDQFVVNSAFQSGCCKPPKDCNFDHTSTNFLVKPDNGTTLTYFFDDDCNRWDNDPDTLCFGCESCKAGLLQDVTSHWFWVGIWLIISGLFVILLLVFANFIGGAQFLRSSCEGYTPLA